MSDLDQKPGPRVAVALQYERPHAPRVVAKGRGELGQAIIDTARQHGIPMEQNPGLAEALSQVELDEQIPRELYRAVATVLGFILRASGQVGPTPRAQAGQRARSPSAMTKPRRPSIRP
jgi:flagellar biosynthesis protein